MNKYFYFRVQLHNGKILTFDGYSLRESIIRLSKENDKLIIWKLSMTEEEFKDLQTKE